MATWPPSFGTGFVRLSKRPKRWGHALIGVLILVTGCGGSDGGTGPSADYTLSLAPPALTIVQGANANTAVTLTRTNFTLPVTLGLTGAPAGVTGAFDPASPAGTSSTLTVSVAGSVVPGVYNLVVSGIGSPGARSTPLTLTVTERPSYTFFLSSPSRTVAQGATDTDTVKISRTNFTGAVTLSLDGAPGVPVGVTGVFDPAAPTGTSSVLTLSVAASVAPGKYDLMIVGAGTPGMSFAPLTLYVTSADYGLALSSTDLSVEVGAAAPDTITISRTNFTGAVTMSLGGAPTGVTGAFDPAAPIGTSSVLTLSVGALVTPGVYNLTVDGSSTLGARSTPLTLTVTAAPNYALSLSPTSIAVNPGESDSTGVTITRTDFTDDVTLSLGGAPAGVTGTFTPATTTGTLSKLVVAVDGSVAPGLYNLTVDGSATLGARSTPLLLAVLMPGGGNVTVDFSSCLLTQRPVWFAYQDGTGPWTPVTGVGGVFQFNITQGKGGYAFVLDEVAGTSTTIRYNTQARLTNRTIPGCVVGGTRSTVVGSVAGLGPDDLGYVSLGGRSQSVSQSGVDFSLMALNGTFDLVAFRWSVLGNPGAAIIRRDQVIPPLADVGTLDFDGGEAFAPATASITVDGLVGGDPLQMSMSYWTGASCTQGSLFNMNNIASPFTALGIPAGQQRADDFHLLTVFQISDTTLILTSEWVHALASHTVTLGAPMPSATITQLAGPYARLQAEYDLPADYNFAWLSYTDDSESLDVSIQGHIDYFGGTNVTLAMPDFSGVAGWQDGWAPPASNFSNWQVQGTFGITPCTAGVTGSAQLRGTYTY